MNLAPPGITVDGVLSGENGDKLSVSLMDIAALWWLEKIDSRLVELVEVEFAVPISQGMRLCELVPLIARAIPRLSRNADR